MGYGLLPLHLTIIASHIPIIGLLVSTFGTDFMLPIRLIFDYEKSPQGAIIMLVLAAELSGSQSADVTRTLLSLDATPTQSHTIQVSALHYAVMLENVAALKVMLEESKPKAMAALNHISVDGSWALEVGSPLLSAIDRKQSQSAKELLSAGSDPFISYEVFA